MLLSMTGFGEARRETESLNVAVEVRAVNNRYLKVMTRAPDAYAAFENKVERIVRRHITRGTVNVTIRASLVGEVATTRINNEAVTAYWQQLTELSSVLGCGQPKDCTSLLTMPNAVFEGDDTTQGLRDHWDTVAAVLEEAVVAMNTFRATEGQSMAADLERQCEVIRTELATVIELAPEVVVDYRDRILERVRELLSGTNVSASEDDVIREVSIFAERCDINEEIRRLQAHIEQFDNFLAQDQSQGRKLEFLIQEMFRETNTIGSKANNVRIAHSVVEMKSAIEKMREMVQNIE